MNGSTEYSEELEESRENQMNNQSPVANVIVDQSEMSEYHEPKGFDFKFLRDPRERKQQPKVPKI